MSEARRAVPRRAHGELGHGAEWGEMRFQWWVAGWKLQGHRKICEQCSRVGGPVGRGRHGRDDLARRWRKCCAHTQTLVFARLPLPSCYHPALGPSQSTHSHHVGVRAAPAPPPRRGEHPAPQCLGLPWAGRPGTSALLPWPPAAWAATAAGPGAAVHLRAHLPAACSPLPAAKRSRGTWSARCANQRPSLPPPPPPTRAPAPQPPPAAYPTLQAVEGEKTATGMQASGALLLPAAVDECCGQGGVCCAC